MPDYGHDIEFGYFLGWKDRPFGVPAEHARRHHPGGGLLRPVATVDGIVVGTWSARRSRGQLAAGIDPFTSLAPGAAMALQDDAADIGRFEGLTLASA